jgi:hypothetical protein
MQYVRNGENNPPPQPLGGLPWSDGSPGGAPAALVMEDTELILGGESRKQNLRKRRHLLPTLPSEVLPGNIIDF